MTPTSIRSLMLLAVVSSLGLTGTDRAFAGDEEKVIWYGTLDGGLAEAKRSGRPIILLSAAPHCQAVSGIW